jgi:PAS domain S-box-containing protein
MAAHLFATAAVVLSLIALATAPSKTAHHTKQPGSSIFGERIENRLEQLQDVHWAITENETRLRDLLDSHDDMILRRDSNGCITFANKAFCEAFAIDPKKVSGSTFEPIVIEREVVTTATGETDRRQRAIELVETSYGPRWIAWEHLPRAHLGTGTETQITGRDVTIEREAAADLREARDQADMANRAKSRFLAAVSHEIRTPMNGILGMAGLLSDTPLAPDQATYIRAIDQSAKNLLTLIDEILDFSKIEAGKLVLNDEPFSLETTVQAAVELLAPGAEEKGLDLAWIIGPDCEGQFKGDAARVRQIILNLVSNAIKFTDRGGVLVTLSRKPIGDTPNRATIDIRVTDTGIGLSSPEQTAIFSEFEQTDSAIKRQRGGTGLGLTISMQLARAMGGDISVQSAPGQGSSFTVTLTLDVVSVADRCRVSLPDGLGPILVTSDRLIERQAISIILKNHGLQAVESPIDQAKTSIEAAGQQGKPFTRVLVDGDCDPEMAAAILESAKDVAGAEAVKGLVLVGVLGRRSLEAFRTSGYLSYVVRPVRPHSLISQLVDHSDLPAPQLADTPHAASVAANAIEPVTKQRVLLVEDNAVNELLARRLLEKSGFEVISAADGIEAIDFADAIRSGTERPVAMILMDVQMPRLNGIEAALSIKAAYASDSKKIACPPIVAVTANAFAEDRERYLAAGMDDYLAKPFDAAGLRAVLARWQPSQVA